MITPKTMTEDDWIATYKPKPAPGSTSGFDYGDGCTLVETYGDDNRELLDAADPKTIWTVLDDGESTVIVTGLHHVNRIGHIITENPWTDDIEVLLDED